MAKAKPGSIEKQDTKFTASFVQRQVFITSAQAQRIEELATELELSKAEVFRRIIDDYFTRRDFTTVIQRLSDVENRVYTVEEKLGLPTPA